MESFGESIEVSKAYVLPDLNQSQRAFPERIDVRNHSFLCKIEFPEVDIKRVHSCGKQHPLYTYRKKFESLKMQGKDFIIVSVFAVVMVLRIPRESQ